MYFIKIENRFVNAGHNLTSAKRAATKAGAVEVFTIVRMLFTPVAVKSGSTWKK